MKKIVKDILFGILIIIVVTIFEFIVTLPFGEPAKDITREEWAILINRELLLTSLPTVLITFAFAWRIKTKHRKDAIRRGGIWTCMLALNYTLIGIGNDNYGLIYSKPGIYVLLICGFIGPIIYVVLSKKFESA